MHTLRDATKGDLDAIEQIYRHYVDTSTATFEESNERSTAFETTHQLLDKLHLPFIVAESTTTRQVIGYAFVKPFHIRAAYRYTVENSIYIDKSYIGQGLGRLLLRSLIDRLQSTPIRQIIAYMSIMPYETEDSSATLRLHRSCGFVAAGRLRSVGYKFDQWIDVACYQLSITGRPQISDDTTLEAGVQDVNKISMSRVIAQSG